MPRRFAPRNDSGEASSRPMPSLPCTRCHAASFHAPDAPHGLAPADTPLPSACHCEERGGCTATWQSASPQRSLASWHYFGQICIRFSVFAGKSCFLLCPAARRTDCHVASLLAMTVGRCHRAPCPRSPAPLPRSKFPRTRRAPRLCKRKRVTAFCMSLQNTPLHT